MRSRAEWMAGRYGLMVHYLPPMMVGRDGKQVAGVDAAAEAFRVERFLADFDRTGADYLIFTLGQNTGMYNCPNPVIENYAGPGHCPRRDLVMELAEALNRRGKHLIAYLPTELHCNFSMQQGFGWIPIEDMNEAGKHRQELFQQRWCEGIRYWSTHYGKLLGGWWLDGCAWLEMDHPRWVSAMRAGNPETAISFSYAEWLHKETAPRIASDDYFSGEVFMLRDGLPRLADGPGFRPQGGTVPETGGMIQHALVPIDAHWWHGGSANWCTYEGKRFIDPALLKVGEMEPPMYTDSELSTLFDAFPGQGGALTLNAGIFLDGSLGEETVAQLERLSRQFKPSNCML